MKTVAEFFKVSFSEFKKAFDSEEVAKLAYDKVEIPKRATSGSAGYDFVSPIDINLKPGQSITIPTGIRCKIKKGWALLIFPRSSLGFKYRLQLDNTVGIVDADYFNAENEGHIFVKLTNDTHTDKTLNLKSGSRFAQGVFMEFGVAKGDAVNKKRVGGFGSTNS